MYERYFGLIEPPFNVTPNPRCFFFNCGYQEAFSALCSGIQRRAGIIVITGEAGTGKTTLLKLFLGRGSANTHTSCILDPHLNFSEILLCTADAFGLQCVAPEPLTIRHQLERYLIAELGKGHFVALLLDEAQGLHDTVLEQLRCLSDLEDGGKKLLQLVLIGQPGLESRLERSSLRSINGWAAAHARLAPLSGDDIPAYIRFRLSAAGHRGRSIFVPRAIERIGSYSRGIPRLINVICDNALLVAYAKSQKVVDGEMIEEVADELQLGHIDSAGLKSTSTTAPSLELLEKGRQYAVVDGKSESLLSDWPVLDSKQITENATDRFWADIRGKRSWAALPAALLALIAFSVGGTLWFSRQEQRMFLSPGAPSFQQTDGLYPPRPGRVDRAADISGEHIADLGASAQIRKDSSKSTKTGNGGNLAASQPEQKYNGRASAPRVGQPPPGEQRSVERRKTLVSRAELKVSENSLVRDKPSSTAEIIATLRPGTEIRLVRRIGEYLLIQSMEEGMVRGYVHIEDAFFKPSDNHASLEY